MMLMEHVLIQNICHPEPGSNPEPLALKTETLITALLTSNDETNCARYGNTINTNSEDASKSHVGVCFSPTMWKAVFEAYAMSKGPIILHTNAVCSGSLLHIDIFYTVSKKNVWEKSRECHNHKTQPFPDPRGRGNQQIQTSTNQTNVRKALRLALSSPSEVIAILKGLKNTRTKWHTGRHTPNRLVD